ncbi:PH domain-containing protein [Nocardia crassostreae]|uniref:PH domain-containing protein n=1 Tax=Nocardia crassostreae TaxID=53428 RepID=UPI000A566F52|nr:PH domain-containing protein [Nocardia crassostreae]
MPVVRIWKRDGGSEEPPRKPVRPDPATDTTPPATESKSGDAEVPATEQKSDREPESAADRPGGEWDLEVTPRHAIMTARIVAAVLFLVFLLAGVFLRIDATGVNFRVTDQVAMAVIGLFLAGGVLMLTRPRVRVGAQGVAVRNILGDNVFRWQDIRGISFPDKKSWARLELVHDEYIPMMAIRSNDKMRAAAAMDRFRELGAKYTEAQPD